MSYSVAEIEAARARRAVRRNAPVRAAVVPSKSPAEDARPVVRLSIETHEAVDAAVGALGPSTLFQRDGELVRVVRAVEPDGHTGTVAGTPLIRPVTLPTIREELTRVARWERFDKRSEGFRPCAPPDTVAAAVLARGEWPTVRPLVAVTETPCLRHDGTILDRDGYDRSTGMLLALSEPAESVPEVPTQADAMRALVDLLDIFADFPFANDAARYVPIAGILTMLARPAIRGSVPMIAVDASTRGSGKTLVADAAALIATGRTAPRLTWPPDEVELEKVLASCALYGSRLVALDNIAGTLGSAPLDKVLTADDRVALRPLGRSEMRELAWRALVVATGNNLVLGADTARRTLVCRLEPREERPEERTGFRHGDLLGHVRANRARLVAAGLTVLRGFVSAGRPGADGFTWGSFASWAALVPAAIVWAGGANVLDARAVNVGAPDAETDALRAVLGGLSSFADGRSVSTRTLVASLWPRLERGEPRSPDGWDALRDGLEVLCPPRRPGDPPDALRLGKALRKHVGRVVGGRRLSAVTSRAGVAEWRVES